MKVTLISGRTVKQGTSLEVGKTSKEYFENVATVQMNEADMREIGVGEGESVKISTDFGSTVVKCKKSNVDQGIAFMPYGPWVSMVIGKDTQGTGMPDSKSVEAKISATDKGVLTVEGIVDLVRGIVDDV
jgi:formylmethanofuran dehydrogenase subunit D